MIKGLSSILTHKQAWLLESCKQAKVYNARVKEKDRFGESKNQYVRFRSPLKKTNHLFISGIFSPIKGLRMANKTFIT